MKKVILGLIFWFGIGYINYGYTLGYFTHRFPENRQEGISGFVFMMGPLALPATIFFATPHRWLTTPYTEEQRWEAAQKKFPGITREEFEEDFN